MEENKNQTEIQSEPVYEEVDISKTAQSLKAIFDEDIKKLNSKNV